MPKVDERFDITKEQMNQIELVILLILEPSISSKTTALGRFKHENAEVVFQMIQKWLYTWVMMKKEYIYKYVSNNKYDKNNGTGGDLLENGRLYVAHFEESEGKWIELNLKNTGFDPLINKYFHKRSATNAGATPMDDPNGLHQIHLILRYIVHLPIIKIGELKEFGRARNAQFRSQPREKVLVWTNY